MNKKIISILLLLTIMVSAAGCSSNDNSAKVEEAKKYSVADSEYKCTEYASMSPEEIVASLSLEQKAAQMVMPAIYNVSPDDMKDNDYGSILSTAGGSIDAASWRSVVDEYQNAALLSDAGIPYIYGQDDVHGVNYCLNAVYFPHNIGQGAANDEELAYQVGLITADEAKLCHMLWNYSPCIAQSADPRWGRTYESYGSDLETITKLSTAYTKGLIDGGLVACAKHFFADGNVEYNTGEEGDTEMLIDRGDARLTDDEINELLKVYQAQIDAGVQTIMISHSSLNGVKMHENKEYIMKLKNEMGFEGFIVSDWESIQHILGSSYKEQVITSINAGIPDNSKYIEEAKKLGKPTVTCIIVGRNVIIDPEDYDDWDSVVMCYLPGSEGKGISDVLCGCTDFAGKLPSPWYGSIDQIGTDQSFLECGYGLTYGSSFQPKKEPETKREV